MNYPAASSGVVRGKVKEIPLEYSVGTEIKKRREECEKD